jgi:hypothetical protein
MTWRLKNLESRFFCSNAASLIAPHARFPEKLEIYPIMFPNFQKEKVTPRDCDHEISLHHCRAGRSCWSATEGGRASHAA